MNDWSRRYEGFQNTPFLPSHLIKGLNQFDYASAVLLHQSMRENIRLGHVAEVFYLNNLVENGLKIQSNIQLVENTVTLGELDFVLEQEKKTWHIEAAFKFYLYDPTIKGDEILKWIGPNRKDSLFQKLDRIQNHQFQIIEKDAVKKQLKERYSIDNIDEQAVLFKAQLFIPLGSAPPQQNIEISGYYLNLEQLASFSNHKFYCPIKMDWFCEPYTGVKWENLENISLKITKELSSNYAPMLWVKTQKGELFKVFVVWW